MREILFRGKRTDNGEWVEGGFTLDAIDNPRITIKTNDKMGLIFNEVSPESVGQFTGMVDKNGVKIFEGDIIAFEQIKNFRKRYIFPTAVIMEDNGRNGVGWTQFSPRENVRIIGNIHDNPELLNKKTIYVK